MTEPKKIDWRQVEAIVDTHRDQTWALIPLLQEVQEAFGYIPPESIEPIAEALNIFPSRGTGSDHLLRRVLPGTEREIRGQGLSRYRLSRERRSKHIEVHEEGTGTGRGRNQS